jgi:hypothetical protein
MNPDIRQWKMYCLVLLLLTVSWLAAGALGEATGRQRIARMSVAEKQDLLDKKQLFYGLDASEQQRLRSIHQQIHEASDRPLLEAMMKRYSEWVQTLPAPQRVELSSMQTDECVAAVRHMLSELEERRLAELATRRLDLEDMRSVSSWLDEVVRQHESTLQPLLEEIIKDMPQLQRRQLSRIRKPSERARVLTASMIMRAANSGEPMAGPLQLDQHFTDLISQLSPTGQDAYTRVADAREQQRMVGRWIITAALWSLTAVSDEELERFYLEDLDVNDRDYIDQLSGVRFRQKLVELYRRYQRSQSRFDTGQEGGAGRPGQAPGRSRPANGPAGNPLP